MLQLDSPLVVESFHVKSESHVVVKEHARVSLEGGDDLSVSLVERAVVLSEKLSDGVLELVDLVLKVCLCPDLLEGAFVQSGVRPLPENAVV